MLILHVSNFDIWVKLEFLFYYVISPCYCPCLKLNLENKGHIKTRQKVCAEKMEKKTRSKVTAVGLKINKIKDFSADNLTLPEYWLKRVNAVVIDYFVILFFTGIMGSNLHFFEFVLTSGIISLIYFSVMETRFGYTLGKKLFSLKVVTLKKHKPKLKTSIIRNISKLNVILLVADTIIGYTTKSHQKYVDKISNTKVVEVSVPKPKPISEIIYYEEPTEIS